MSFPSDTIAALATPVGTSAIAVVRASGPQTPALAVTLFGERAPPRVARRADYRDASGRVLDDVLFTCFAAPNSYTGEDSLEISCHGNPYLAQRILEDLFHRGCRPAEPGEFTKRAFLNGRMDLTQAEAVMDLIHARSERALAAANQQLRGSLGRTMTGMVSKLIGVLATVEAYIDFPEEDLPPENRAAIRLSLEELQYETGRLLLTGHYGELLREGIRTVIVGEPNAGKSSLLNRLVGRDRALVSPEPGTTRDYLEEVVSMGPHLLRLIDTAGLNSVPSPIERQGMDKTLEQARQAHLVLWVIDSTHELPSLAPEISGLIRPETAIAVFNKTDLPSRGEHKIPAGIRSVRVSALTGGGLDQLESTIVALAEECRKDAGEEIVVVNARHTVAIENARSGIGAALAKLESNSAPELLASDLREAMNALGEIAGRIDNEAVLDRLFATFCIGK